MVKKGLTTGITLKQHLELSRERRDVTSGTGRDVEAVEGAREFCVKDMGSEMCARAVRPPH